MFGVVSQCFGGSFWREGGFGESCVDGSVLWLALARGQLWGAACWWERSRTSVLVALSIRRFSRVMYWWERFHSVLVARFGEKAASGSLVLVWREDFFRRSCVGGNEGTVFRWLALAGRQFPRVVCRWELSRSVFCGLALTRRHFSRVRNWRSQITAFW